MDFVDEEDGLEVASALMFATTILTVNVTLRARARRHISREPYSFRDKPMSTIMRRVFFEGERHCLDVTRMRKGPFLKLCGIMREKRLLSDSINLTVEEQMVMFLFTLGHSSLQRGNTNNFGRSGETVNRYFYRCLHAVDCLRYDYIKSPPTTTPPEIASRPNKFYPYFKDCIGAIDGTHIDATVSHDIVARFRGRKDHPTQNILLAITYNMRFCFVGAGWEGSANDMTVLRCALDVPDGLKVPEGKYFLADAGYTTMPGFITPYRGVRYHLKEYSSNGPKNLKELFNLRHSSLRNTVERAIGVLKKRFRRLTTRSYYPYRTQVDTVVACAILHNYIMGEVPSGDEFVTGEFCEPHLPDVPPEPESDPIPEAYEDYTQQMSQRARRDRNREWQLKRDELASQMWNDYRYGARVGDRGL